MTARQLTAEFLGTALLLVAIVGSGITASIGGAASARLFQHAVVVGFVAAQTVGALAAAALIRWLFAPDAPDARPVVVPHDTEKPLALPAEQQP